MVLPIRRIAQIQPYTILKLLVAALTSCHLLWYLHLCADAGIRVVEYIDHAVGHMIETADGKGYFKEVILKPAVTISEKDKIEQAIALHSKAHKKCCIANSVNFEVLYQSSCIALNL